MVFLGASALLNPLVAATINGFNIDERSVPATHLVRAAPAKDSIQAIMEPQWGDLTAGDWLADTDEVLSITMGEETRAYPLRILVWHEVVNDQFGDIPVAITYSALSGSGIAFAPGNNPDGSTRTFGVSGVLYNSCLLMYDHATESLWSQMGMASIAGEANETALELLPVRRMSWAAWKQAFPAGKVLTRETGFAVDYLGDWPYGDYAFDRATIFPFDVNRNEFSTKERVVGYVGEDAQRCWPLAKLQEKGQLYDAIGAQTIKVTYNADTGDVLVQDMTTRENLPVISCFWFAWQAFHADTSVWIPLR
ncbi:DUF3179 domain-containing protein [Actomonas aquatica]|uniref:DUF3179 domain-containing protein n=1 Tax=Actomonas aquatica TaxID=2866162 RepID=A0ABZ1CBR7_9BACT|nr:DUF3179 domain-containing protein [Opitutus sp. WL0086]WRQ89001.1 DUF3179 domain-containing protein [Opitutus sp. WL0086]